jgi:histidinol-phosphate phosphatase family protein
MHPAIFLDRDGVLIENRPNYVRDWSQVSTFPAAILALSRPALKAYKIVIVTNQSAVGRGIISRETADDINNQLVGVIRDQGGRVDAVYMCPHTPEDNCPCRKPKPGLLLQAANELSLDLERSWMVGDAWTDLQAGQSAGVSQSILVTTGRGTEQALQERPKDIAKHLIVENLAQAIDAILARDKKAALNTRPSQR